MEICLAACFNFNPVAPGATSTVPDVSTSSLVSSLGKTLDCPSKSFLFSPGAFVVPLGDGKGADVSQEAPPGLADAYDVGPGTRANW